jgi:hypothetical protein
MRRIKMDAKRIVKLTKAIRSQTREAVSIEQVVWSSDYGSKVEYKIFWFQPDGQDCHIKVFNTFTDLLAFVKETWNV